jgi:hypothetical protein
VEWGAVTSIETNEGCGVELNKRFLLSQFLCWTPAEKTSDFYFNPAFAKVDGLVQAGLAACSPKPQNLDLLQLMSIPQRRKYFDVSLCGRLHTRRLLLKAANDIASVHLLSSSARPIDKPSSVVTTHPFGVQHVS